MSEESDVDTGLSFAPRLSEMLAVEPGALGDLEGEARDLIVLGEVLLLLISDWSAWLERRVETVRFVDADTAARSVSVNFILPRVPTPLFQAGDSITFAPVGTLLKRELVNFDLRDEDDRPLPLLSRRHNGRLAAAVLAAGVRMWVGDSANLEGSVPVGVLEDLWNIATSTPDDAMEYWSRLGIPRTTLPDEKAWRKEMLLSGRFMALARDLARNFLVLTPIALDGRSRVIKFSYQEVGEIARVRLRQRRRMVGAIGDQRPPRRSPPREKGLIHVSAMLSQDAGPDITDVGNPPPSEPLQGVRVRLDGGDKAYEGETGPDGSAVVQAALGAYVVNYVPPDGFFGSSPMRTCKLLSPGEEIHIQLECHRGHLFTDSAPSAPHLKLRDKLRRAFALAPKPIEISMPSVGQCASYHLQFETADGMHITEAKIRHTASVTTATSVGDTKEVVPLLTPLQQRVGLSATDVPADRAAAATFSVRPRPSMIVRAAFYVSLLGCVISLLTIVGRSSLSIAPEPWVTLLLVVPGGLSAYVSRERENLFATEALIGLRSLALTTGLWSLLGAAVIALTREMTTNKGAPQVGSEHWWTLWSLLLLFAGNLITTLVLFIAWRRAHSPPEFRKSVRRPI